MLEAERHTFQILTKRAERLNCARPAAPLASERLDGRLGRERTLGKARRYLREVPAPVRFVSAEPLLGPLDALDLTGIDWLIVGGRVWHRPPPDATCVGPRAPRPLPRRRVPFFFKQWGGARSKSGGRRLDGSEYFEIPVGVTLAVGRA